jgi:hypothetical protein
MDVELPEGKRSWSVSQGHGYTSETDGSVHKIPYHNAMNMGSYTLPFTRIIADLNDPAVAVSYKVVPGFLCSSKREQTQAVSHRAQRQMAEARYALETSIEILPISARSTVMHWSFAL